jgi:hypothetical protein
VAELHPRALTQLHPEGNDAAFKEFTPTHPEFIALTQRRDHQTDYTYSPDRYILNRTKKPYRYMGRVYQHYHRYYDIYVRSDIDIPPFPESVVVNVNGPKPDNITTDPHSERPSGPPADVGSPLPAR